MADLPQWAADAGDAQAAIAMENLLAMGDQPVEDRTNWLANFIARALAEAAKPGWKPIAEAPKDGRWFLAWCPKQGRHLMRWKDSKTSETASLDWYTGQQPEATHWMPLPAAPEVG